MFIQKENGMFWMPKTNTEISGDPKKPGEIEQRWSAASSVPSRELANSSLSLVFTYASDYL